MKLDLLAAHKLSKASKSSFSLLFKMALKASRQEDRVFVIDVGSFRGSFAQKALASYGDADVSVHCFDAFPGNIEMAQAAVNDPRVTFVNAAVTAENHASVTFSIPKRSFVDSGKASWGGRVALDPSAAQFEAEEQISVPGVSLDSYLLSKGIYAPMVVKMDIQGGEYDALEGMRLSAPDTSFLYVECQLKHGRDLRYLALLEEMGFAVVMDSFQFGMRPELSKAECEAICKVLDLEIVGFPSQGVIHAVARPGAQIPEALAAKSAFAPFFTYFQTDLLAVNTRQPAAMAAFHETLLSR